MLDWARLSHDLLIEIGKRLTSIESYDSFGAVCRSWRAATSRDKQYLKQKTFQDPWLMLAEKSPKYMRKFLNVSSGKTRKIFLPEARNKRCLSFKDWLFIIEEDLIGTSIFHLVSCIQIVLPNLNTFPDYDSLSYKQKKYFIDRFVLSTNSSSTSDFTVTITRGDLLQMGFCKLGDTSWTAMDAWITKIHNIIYYNNKLYAMEYGRRFVKCDVNGPSPTQLRRAFFLPISMSNYTYLVEFSNKLFLVGKYEETDFYLYEKRPYRRTLTFKVYEVNIDDGGGATRVEIKDLENKALFLSYNSSFFVDCSEINNCKPNCIYYLEDRTDEYFSKMRIYHLSNGSVESVFDEKIEWNKFTPPSWIGPGF